MPWRAAVDPLLGAEAAKIEEHNAVLAGSLLNHISNTHKFRLVSPTSATDRSAIATVSHLRKKQNPKCTYLDKAGIDMGFRRGHLRFAFRTPRAVELLNSAA